MFIYLEQIIISYAEHMPLTIFAFVASFFEELIPPIPSPSIVITTGSLALIQDYTIYGLIVLAIVGSLGKTIGASAIYYLSDKAEDLLAGKIYKFIGVTHEKIESFGARLGKGSRDYIILIILRALPIIPSTIISIGSGLLKIDFKLFIISTFVGSIIRDFLYIYLGYIGTNLAISFIKNTANIESSIQIFVVLIVILSLGYLYDKRRKAKS